ncbi:MAG: hypothetical protein ACM33T_06295 [Solirubrobacterales bacterium]
MARKRSREPEIDITIVPIIPKEGEVLPDFDQAITRLVGVVARALARKHHREEMERQAKAKKDDDA